MEDHNKIKKVWISFVGIIFFFIKNEDLRFMSLYKKKIMILDFRDFDDKEDEDESSKIHKHILVNDLFIAKSITNAKQCQCYTSDDTC